MAPPEAEASLPATDGMAEAMRAPPAIPTPAAAPRVERRREPRAGYQPVKTSLDAAQIAEPILLALVLTHAVSLLLARVITMQALHGVALAAMGAALIWSMHERIRHSYYPLQGLARMLRAATIAASAPLFTFMHASFGWPWLWILGMVIAYPFVMRPLPAALFVIGLALYGEVLAMTALKQIGSIEIFVRVVAFLSLGYVSYSYGRTINATALALRGLQIGEQRAQAIAAHTGVLMIIADRDYRVMHVNHAVERILGYSVRGFKAAWNRELIHPEDRRKFFRERHRMLAESGGSRIVTLRARHLHGHWVWLEVRLTNLLDNRAVQGVFASATDITQRVEAERKRRDESALLRTVIDHLPAYIYTKDRNGLYLISNRANLQRIGRGREAEVIGRRAGDFYPQDMAEKFEGDDQSVIASGVPIIDKEYSVPASDGTLHWYQTTKLPLRDGADEVVGLVGITRDTTDHKVLEEFLRHQASHDALTGLHNRRHFTERLDETMRDARQQQRSLALVFCDLDFFKSINDRYGHEVGDEFLRALAERMAPLGRLPGRALARFGGDEFVLFATLDRDDEAAQLGNTFLSTARQPITLAGVQLQAEASIGVALLRPDHLRPEELIRDADTAMYEAKESGRNRIALFDETLRQRAQRRAGLAQALRSALERNELKLVYQPKVELRNGQVSGFEVLMRWNSPEFGVVPPSEFIPLAEESGLIVPMGLWALDQSCRQLRCWQERYPRLDDMTLSVNVSMRQLLHEPFVSDVARIVEQSLIYPATLELEITESAAMRNPDQTVDVLHQLKASGLRLAMDDFGTGYSSLAYLRRLPVDVLKIDRAFVRGIESESDDAEIVRLVIALTRTLGIHSVAEGVESQANAEELKRLGCDVGQGYFFAHPLSADEADLLLRRNQAYTMH